jgi:hypothetical protein
MKLFACVDVLGEQSFLRVEMSIDCSSNEHKFLSKLIGVPFILLFSIGIPFFLFWKVHKIKARHLEDLNHIEWTEYAYITRSYKPKMAMWESVLMIRKMGIAFLSVILPGFSFNVQALWGSNWLLVFLMLQTLYWPYRFRFINALETISLTLTIMTFNFGWYMGTSNYLSNSSDSDESISGLIVAVNFMFLVFMIFVIVLNALRRVKNVYKTEIDKVEEEDGALEISLLKQSKTPLLASTSNADS